MLNYSHTCTATEELNCKERRGWYPTMRTEKRASLSWSWPWPWPWTEKRASHFFISLFLWHLQCNAMFCNAITFKATHCNQSNATIPVSYHPIIQRSTGNLIVSWEPYMQKTRGVCHCFRETKQPRHVYVDASSSSCCQSIHHGKKKIYSPRVDAPQRDENLTKR